MTGRSIVVGLALAAVSLFSAVAYAAETLSWDDLSPPWDASQDPMKQLPEAQQIDLSTLIWGPNYGDPTGIRNDEEQQAYDRLKASGTDPDALLETVQELSKRAARSEKTLIRDLDSKVIRLPGYVLPVEFDGKAVKAFLLVPYVGACIHVPPPPPNQIVYVQTDSPFESEGLFAAVWVTGQMSVGMGTKALTLLDGTSGVDFGYSLSATSVEPYKE
ncbi:MAG: DUF3299 domain-containing protein [Hyphomicrobiales bacterium]